MIHEHLQRSAMNTAPVAASVHLDEDALSAFVEGRLSEQESAPVLQHLVGCGFCRRITAQLVRLETEMGATQESASDTTAQETDRLSRLKDLVSRVLPQPDGDTVFAYHAPAEDFKPKEEESKTETADDSPDEKSKEEEKQ